MDRPKFLEFMLQEHLAVPVSQDGLDQPGPSAVLFREAPVRLRASLCRSASIQPCVGLCQGFCQFQHRRDTNAAPNQERLLSRLHGESIAQRPQHIDGIPCLQFRELLCPCAGNAVNHAQFPCLPVNAAQTDWSWKQPGAVLGIKGDKLPRHSVLRNPGRLNPHIKYILSQLLLSCNHSCHLYLCHR